MNMRFREWLRLDETMDVRVVGHDARQRVDNLSEVAPHILWSAARNLKGKMSPEEYSNFGAHTLMPDGYEDDMKDSGVLNFYVDGFSPQTVQLVLKAAKYFLGEVGWAMGTPTTNTHQDKVDADLAAYDREGDDLPDPEFQDYVPRTLQQKKGDYMQRFAATNRDPSHPRVVRIPVRRVSQSDASGDAPELNMANDSAVRIFQDLLNYRMEDDGGAHGYGPIPARDLLIKISNLTPFQKQNVVEPGKWSAPGDKAQVFSQGYDLDRIERYLSQIEAICRWAIQNGHDYVSCF